MLQGGLEARRTSSFLPSAKPLSLLLCSVHAEAHRPRNSTWRPRDSGLQGEKSIPPAAPSSSISPDPAIRRILSGKMLPRDTCAQLPKHQFIIWPTKINASCQAVNGDIQHYFTSYSAIPRPRTDPWEGSLLQTAWLNLLLYKRSQPLWTFSGRWAEDQTTSRSNPVQQFNRFKQNKQTNKAFHSCLGTSQWLRTQVDRASLTRNITLQPSSHILYQPKLGSSPQVQPN